MNNQILGDKRRTSFDDNLANIVNAKFDSMPDVVEKGIPSEVDLSKLDFEILDEPMPMIITGDYEDMLKRIQEYGDRFPRPAEYFALMAEVIRNPESKYKEVFNNIVRGHADEWTSAFCYLSGGVLTVILDPKLVWNELKKDYEVITGPERICKQFNLVKPGEDCSELLKIIDLGDQFFVIKHPELNLELIKFLFGDFENLPHYLLYNIKLRLPKEGTGSPIAISPCDFRLFTSEEPLELAGRGVFCE